MVLEFTKMNAAGNDFVLIDNRAKRIALSNEQVVRLCNRQRGIGADGLFMLVGCESGRADWTWQFYNSDGSVAEMCGNGARCFARFVQRLTGADNQITVQTGAGVITAEFQCDRVTITLTPPRELCLNRELKLSDGLQTVHSINTGVPHAVLFVPEADQAPVQRFGAEIRYHTEFSPRGTNVNFVQPLGPDYIRVRTYERGVEGETLACGTGVTASALIAALVHKLKSPVKVRVQGGDTLEVAFKQQGQTFSEVKLGGPAEFVFEGRINI